MDNSFNLPTINDFKKGGIFHQIKLDKKKPLPPELMKYIFPDYIDMLFKQKSKPNKKTMDIIFDYCISTKKTAMKEENILKKKLQKDVEMRHMEEKMKEYFETYYKNLYKHCTCVKKK